MLADITEEIYYGLLEFIKDVKENEDFQKALTEFLKEFKKDLKEGRMELIEKTEINAENIDQLLKELKEKKISLDTDLSTDEMVYYATLICEKADVLCEVFADENGDLVVRFIYPHSFNPRAFKNVAVLYYLEREDKPELTNHQWLKFKELYETDAFPESTWEEIKEYEIERQKKVMSEK